MIPGVSVLSLLGGDLFYVCMCIHTWWSTFSISICWFIYVLFIQQFYWEIIHIPYNLPVFIQLYAHGHNLILESFVSHKRNSVLISSSYPFPTCLSTRKPQATTDLFSVSRFAHSGHFVSMESYNMWSLWLASYT